MKRALVISGGGSKGAFAVGVLKQLFALYPNLDFDIYVGTSAGSLVVSLASLKEIATLEKIYTTISNKNLFEEDNIGNRINEHSLYEVNGAWNLIDTNYSDTNYQQLLNSNKKVFLTTVCLQTSGLTVFTNDAKSITPTNYKVIQLTSGDHYRKALLASCCEPVFMPPIQVNKNVTGINNPDYQYVDGGVLKYAGVQMAIDAGATEIFVILLSPETTDTVPNQFTALFPILEQLIDILTSNVGKTDILTSGQYASALQYINDVKAKMINAGISPSEVDNYFTLPYANMFQGKNPIKIFKIRPAGLLGGGPGGLTFDPTEMKAMLAKGTTATNDFAATTPKGDITWA